MKKYFLLITLFVIGFLWLGNNYTHGQAECDAQCPGGFTATTVDGQIVCTCKNSPTPTDSSTKKCGTEECSSTQKCIDSHCKNCSDPDVCCGISLNTNIPFIGKCIEDNQANRWSDETSVTWTTAFPVLMWSLTKILVTLILIISFVLIIIGGIMIATGNPSGGKKMIINVVIGIALLGASGVILRLINPNFFG